MQPSPFSTYLLRRHFLSVAFAFVVLFLGSISARADAVAGAAPPTDGNLTLSATGSETVSSASNPLLAVGNTRALVGSTTAPELALKDATPASSLGVDATLDQNIFNQSAFDSTDLHAHSDFYQQNQNWTISAQQRVDDDTTRTSELSNYGITGINAVHHLGLSSAPQITYTPNTADALSVAGSVATSQYANDSFTNYATYAVTPSYARHLDPLNTASFSVQAQRYLTTDNAAARIDSIGPMVGWSTVFTPRLSATVAAGAQTSRAYDGGSAATPWQWQGIYSATLSFKGQQDIVDLAARRAQYPYGNGTDALQSVFSLNESHALNRQFSLDVGGDYRSSSYQSIALYSPQTMLRSVTGLTWHATDQIDVAASYQYRYENLTYGAGTAQDNAILFSAVYRPKLWVLSD